MSCTNGPAPGSNTLAWDPASGTWSSGIRTPCSRAARTWMSATGSPILGAALAMLGGIQLLCLGIVGQYVSRIYSEVRGRPLYVVRERVGFTPHPRAVRNVLQFLPSEAAARQETATQRRIQQSLSQEVVR